MTNIQNINKIIRQKPRINMNEAEMLIDDISCIEGRQNKFKSSIIKFVCYFNLFECFCAERNVDHWYNFHEKYYIKNFYLNEYFDFFYNRYVENNKVNNNYYDLCLYVKDEHKNRLEKYLIQKANKLYVLLSISYYFRNNLYHGYKVLFELEKYEVCFEKITDILKTVIINARIITNNSNNGNMRKQVYNRRTNERILL